MRVGDSTEPDEPPTIEDRGDGSYIVSHSMARKGRYGVSVELDGEPIAGSPFATVAVKTFVPPMIKWQTPRVTGASELAGFSHAGCVMYGRSLIIFGGNPAGLNWPPSCLTTPPHLPPRAV